MARQTKCDTLAGAWSFVPGVDLAIGIVGVLGLIFAPVMVIVAALTAAGITPFTLIAAGTVLMFACLFAINLIHKVRDYFFDHRLVCLGDDHCAIARVVSMEDNGDGDKSLNTILAPATESTTEAEYALMFQPAALVFNDPGLASRGWNLNPKEARDPRRIRSSGRASCRCSTARSRARSWTR